MRMAVATMSTVTLLMSAWMGTMYLVLRHPGFLARSALVTVIAAGAALLVTGRPRVPALRAPLAIWGVGLAILGVLGLRSPGDDGWAVLAAAVFVCEGALALFASLRG